MDKVDNLNIHEMHTFLAYRIDRLKLNKEINDELRGKKVTNL